MIAIIVAMDIDNLIGKNNTLPWYYPDDLAYFKKITTGKTVLMGRKTFESIISRNKKPLPNRKNIVLTSNLQFQYSGVEVIHDGNAYLKQTKEDVFVIGGKQVYELALPYAEQLYITRINKKYEGDTYFPLFQLEQFQLIQKEEQGDLCFCIYQRKI